MKLTEEQKEERAAKARATREANEKKKEEARKQSHRKCEIEKALEEGSRTKPTRFYEIGEEVYYGSHDKAVIIDVFGDHEAYEVEVSNERKPYSWSEETYTEVKKTITAWHRMLPISSMDSDMPQFAHEDTMRIQFSQRDIEGLIGLFYTFGVDMDPEYQRGHVWELEDKVALIDSIFNNVDIGKFVFIHLGYGTPGYEILDGKQRMTALIEFFEDRFRYRGKLFSELHPRDRSHIRHYRVGVGETRELSTIEERLQYFLHLNTYGKPQDPMHIAKVESMLADIQKRSTHKVVYELMRGVDGEKHCKSLEEAEAFRRYITCRSDCRVCYIEKISHE